MGFKIVGKKVEGVNVEVKPVEVRSRKKVVYAPPRLVQATKLVVEGGLTPTAAMREMGYTPASIDNVKITKSEYYQQALEEHMDKLILHRAECLDRMREIYLQDAGYGSLSIALDQITKQIQILSGRATGRIVHELDEGEKQKIRDIISSNATEPTEQIDNEESD